MTDLRKAAEMALEALENNRVFVTSREKTKHPEGTEWYDDRIEALRQALAMENFSEVNQELEEALKKPKQEPVEYKEECWACGCEECICATKVPGYYESKIKEAVLAEREACAEWLRDNYQDYKNIADICEAIRARGEK